MDHCPASPSATTRSASGYTAGPLNALDTADTAFRLLTAGPRPLSLHTSQLAEGLPNRLVPLDELRVIPALVMPERCAAHVERRGIAGDG